MDRDNMIGGSCARQIPRLKDLHSAGCEIRTFKPARNGYASLHAKTWILDDEIIITGSINVTHNGLENNKEHCFVLRSPDVVKSVSEDFEATWLTSDPVTDARMSEFLSLHEESMRAKQDAKAVSHRRSLSRTRGDAPRSRSADLEVAPGKEMQVPRFSG